MFKIGEAVSTTDGDAGKLIKVVIDPDSERVTHLIVEKGFLQKTARVVPLAAMANAGENEIRLSISTAELDNLPDFNETQYRVPDPGWERESYQIDDPAHVLRWGIHYAPPQVEEYVLTREEELKQGVDADAPVFGKGSPVYDRDGQVGEISGMEIEAESGKITHLVVKQGVFGGQLVIPMNAVSSVSDTGVSIDLTREQLQQLSGGTNEANETKP